ncbi:MAG TPA: hypothetical protein VM056_01085 [Terriglobales bacterium]|nr:hypothetical protein [Terriglobales bacterium]
MFNSARKLVAILFIACLPAAYAQVTIDRVVAIVNKQVITQSDWDEQERFEALVNGRPPEALDYSIASLDRLIDQVLMREQIDYVRFARITPEQVTAQVLSFRKQIPSAEDDQQWMNILRSYALTPDEFERRVGIQMDVLHFIDMRFRPNVRVESEQIENYYRQSLVPQMMKAGTSAEALPPLKEVEARIRSILSEQRLNEMLHMWLASLRTQGRVKKLVQDAKNPPPSLGR